MSARRNSAFRKMKKPLIPKRAPAPVTGTRAPTYDDLFAIVKLVEAGSRFSEFRLRSGDIEVEFKRTRDGERGMGDGGGIAAAAVPPARLTESSLATPAPHPPSPIPAGAHVIRAPMVGTFYRAPEPGAKPFVEVGTKVKRDTVVCIIEVMKLMNSVAAGADGEVVGIYAENGHAVEPGQALIAVRPR